MRPTYAFIMVLALTTAAPVARPGVEGGIVAGVVSGTETGPPPADAPSALWDVWLRFHEAELCQGLDTVFVFHKNGMEIWCRIEDEKAYQKLSELIAPLRPKYEISLYPTRPSPEKKAPEDDDPPPSLWNNAELRAYLGDPFSRSGIPIDPENPHPSSGRVNDADSTLKRRILLYADQLLDWERRMKRYAMDLPALVGAACCTSLPAGLRERARVVSLAHSQAVERFADRLAGNLSVALPKGEKKSSGAVDNKPAQTAVSGPEAAACQVADAAQNAARRIDRFIHPTQYTVGLLDLRQPNLLEALKGLKKLVSIFLRTLNR